MYKGWGPLGVYNCSSRGPPLYQSNYLLRQKKKCIFLGAQHLLRKNYLSGGIPRQRFVCFEKKGRFRQSETTDSFPKIGLKFPGNLKWFFNDDLSFRGNLFLKRCAVFLSTLHRHTVLQGASEFQKAFGLGVHPTPLPHPDASHQFWVNMAVGSGRAETAWYGVLCLSPHRIDTTCVNQNSFLSDSFLYTKHTPNPVT